MLIRPAALRTIVGLTLVLCLQACSEGAGPDLTGPLYLRGTLGSMPWQADTDSAGTLTLHSDPASLLVAGYRRRADGFLHEAVYVYTGAFHGEGYYPLEASTGGPDAGILVQDTAGPDPTGEYYVTSQRPGTLHITGFDSVTQLVAGTFAFRATDTTSGVTIPVSGSFRLRYVRVVASPPRPGMPQAWRGSGPAGYSSGRIRDLLRDWPRTGFPVATPAPSTGPM